ncbi:MAG TPA: hypothetical protein VNU70_11995 [Puia sp.]|jgi:hypothetical protein|nr:hypothetical protein [Puia sp.]
MSFHPFRIMVPGCHSDTAGGHSDRLLADHGKHPRPHSGRLFPVRAFAL